MLSHVVTEPHPSAARTLSTHPLSRPLHLCQRRLARVKPRRRQLTTQWTIRVPTPIKSLRYSPASLPPPRQPATPHARFESLSSFSLFLPPPRGQASRPAGHTTRDYWPVPPHQLTAIYLFARLPPPSSFFFFFLLCRLSFSPAFRLLPPIEGE